MKSRKQDLSSNSANKAAPRGERKVHLSRSSSSYALSQKKLTIPSLYFSTQTSLFRFLSHPIIAPTHKTTTPMNTKRRPKRSKGSKAKKPKFLSLRLQFPADETKQFKHTGTRHAAAASAAVTNSDRPDLSPIQSQNQAEERENNDHENVAFFFSAADGGATTLTGLLDASTAADSNSSRTEKNSSRLEYLPATAYGEDRAALVRNAMRSRDRDSIEDKWVCYSEVVKEEEVSSSSAVGLPCRAGFQRVSLKLDYEEIMIAWSNKGPLYVDNSQIVPDVNHPEFLSQELTNIQGLAWRWDNSIGVSWAVPEMEGETENGVAKRHEERVIQMGQREASVLRYKEKRQNRLFSRKIRYQVRKLNAEKRPRLKGRFVKRS